MRFIARHFPVAQSLVLGDPVLSDLLCLRWRRTHPSAGRAHLQGLARGDFLRSAGAETAIGDEAPARLDRTLARGWRADLVADDLGGPLLRAADVGSDQSLGVADRRILLLA